MGSANVSSTQLDEVENRALWRQLMDMNLNPLAPVHSRKAEWLEWWIKKAHSAIGDGDCTV